MICIPASCYAAPVRPSGVTTLIHHRAHTAHQPQSPHWEDDIHHMKDGTLAVTHDRRLPFAQKDVRDMTREEYEAHGGRAPLTLQALLATHNAQHEGIGEFYIEMKGAGTNAQNFARAVYHALQAHKATPATMRVFSFQHDNMRRLADMNAQHIAGLGALFYRRKPIDLAVSFGDATSAHGSVEHAGDMADTIAALPAAISFIGVEDTLLTEATPEMTARLAHMLNEDARDIAIWQTNPAPECDTTQMKLANTMIEAIALLRQHGYAGNIAAITDAPAVLHRHMQQRGDDMPMVS